MYLIYGTVTNLTDEKNLLLLKEMGGQNTKVEVEKEEVCGKLSQANKIDAKMFDGLTSRGVRDMFTLLARISLVFWATELDTIV